MATHVREFIDTLLNAYPAFEPKDPAGFVSLWTRKFEEYPPAVLVRAADQWLDSGKTFFPSLPEIKAVVDSTQETGPTADTLDQYWQAMEQYGAQLAGRPAEDPTSSPRHRKYIRPGVDNPEAWEQAQAISREWMK
jgi:hypothetical protein